MASFEVIGQTGTKNNAADVLTIDHPECPKTIKLLPGNWVARELRRYNDESVGHVVPRSSYSKRSYKKYNSLYNMDFSDVTEELMKEFLQQKLADNVDRQKMERARETVADVFGGRKDYHTEEMFARWRIPSSILNDDKPQSSKLLKSESFLTRPKAPTPKSLAGSLPLPPTRSKTMFPDIGRNTPADCNRPVSKSMDMKPNENLPPTRQSFALPRPQTVDDKRASVMSNCMLPPKLNRSRTFSGVNRKYGTPPKGDMKQAINPEMCGKVDDWMRRAPQINRSVIEKLLTMAGKKTELDHAIKRTLNPDAQEEVQKWLETANDEDKQVALQFFSTMGGTGLMKQTENEKRIQLHSVIEALQSEQDYLEGNSPKTKTTHDKKHKKKPTLRFLRLLSPETRDQRWMKTTWHHLPEYKNDNPVMNWSSMYTRPLAPKPRQFVIHPEWG